jgi:DNA-binding IclR family transcriptional regulator
MQKYRRSGSRQRFSALGKGIAVIEAVIDQPQSVGLPDLAARLKLPRQTVHRVLGHLQDDGLLVRDPERERYSVGPRLSSLALSVLLSRNQGAAVRVVLQELVNELQETCNIGVVEGLDYVYLERIECEWPLRIHLEVGDRLPAHTVAGGKIVLAFLSASERKRLLKSRKLVARTPRTLTRIADLERDFETIRETGYATNDQENFEGIVAVSVPIRDKSDRVVASLTMHGPLPRVTLEKCKSHIPRLMQAAQRIANAWGLD